MKNFSQQVKYVKFLTRKIPEFIQYNIETYKISFVKQLLKEIPQSSQNESLGTPVIIDNGSFTCKAGFAGEQTPKVQFPSVMGRPRHTGVMVGMGAKNSYVGQQAYANKSILSINQLVLNGYISNWKDMTQIWQYCFNEKLKVSSSQHPCLLSQPPLNPYANREQTAQIMFETLDVPAFYISVQQSLTLQSSGKTTAIVVDVGHSFIRAAPFHEGKLLQNALQINHLAGRDLTDFLMKILLEREYHFTTREQRRIVENMKEKHCFVALDYQKQIKDPQLGNKIGICYELPDGQPLYLENERFRCPELLFKPSLIGLQYPGLSQNIYRSIQKCDADIRKDLYSNIILSGGSTLFPGIAERIKKDITAMAPQGTIVNIIAPQNRIYSSWIGGSKLASSEAFKQKWITKEQYFQYGSSIVHEKCV